MSRDRMLPNEVCFGTFFIFAKKGRFIFFDNFFSFFFFLVVLKRMLVGDEHCQ